jgi:hypothetical protein
MATSASSESIASPHEIIFSCSICQATITDVYRAFEGDLGFNAGDGGDQERVVTKLWLTECSHLTCGEHLGGGGPRHLLSSHRFFADSGRGTISPRRSEASGAMPSVRAGEERLKSQATLWHPQS